MSIYQGFLIVVGLIYERIKLSKNLYECLVWGFFEYVSKWFSNGDVELCEDLTGKVQEDLKCKIPPSHGADYICTLSKNAKG